MEKEFQKWFKENICGNIDYKNYGCYDCSTAGTSWLQCFEAGAKASRAKCVSEVLQILSANRTYGIDFYIYESKIEDKIRGIMEEGEHEKRK